LLKPSPTFRGPRCSESRTSRLLSTKSTCTFKQPAFQAGEAQPFVDSSCSWFGLHQSILCLAVQAGEAQPYMAWKVPTLTILAPESPFFLLCLPYMAQQVPRLSLLPIFSSPLLHMTQSFQLGKGLKEAELLQPGMAQYFLLSRFWLSLSP
jgi:hypothetical protein